MRDRRAHFVARDDLLTTKQAAAYTGLNPRTIKFMTESGRLPYCVLAGTTRPFRRYRRSGLNNIVIEMYERR